MEAKKGLKSTNSTFKEFRSTQSNSPMKKQLFSQEELTLIKERREQKQKSIEEKLNEVVITTTEKKSLKRVFQLIANGKKYFDGKDISRVLKFMDVHLTKSEIDLMIWVSFPQFKINIFRKLTKIMIIELTKMSLKTCTNAVLSIKVA